MSTIDPAAANALIAALAADRDEWCTSALNWPSLHLDRGRCPTADEPELRDMSCRGCGRLILTAAAVASALRLPSAPAIPPVGVGGREDPPAADIPAAAGRVPTSSRPCDRTAGGTKHYPEAAA